jgi:ABC-type nickel/cobalt efflux system permease component RcnA
MSLRLTDWSRLIEASLTDVHGLDDAIAGIGDGGLLLALLAAFLLGLRHATDPDHLTAVSTLVLSDDRGRPRRASVLGACWGLGHATTLLAIGLPLVLLDRQLPAGVQRAAEVAVGLVIVALAVRLLVRWRRGYLHVHLHEHPSGVRHAHPHVHEHSRGGEHPAAHGGGHDHAHAETLGRTPLASYGVGLVHGVGGSAGVGILLVGSVSGGGEAALALVLFAAASALSMAVVSAGFGHALARDSATRVLERLVPLLATFSLLFGAWYAAGAV